jgi:hypothetical protein
MTQSFQNKFKKLNCITFYISGRCTSFVQVLDVSLNKPLKALVIQAVSDHTDKHYKRYEKGDFTVADQHVLFI